MGLATVIIKVKIEIPFETALPPGGKMVIAPFVNINNILRDIEILQEIVIKIKL